jgi:hypothetical protein
MRAAAGLPLLGQVSVFRAVWAEKRAWKGADVSTFRNVAAQGGLRFYVFAGWLRKAGPFRADAEWERELAGPPRHDASPCREVPAFHQRAGDLDDHDSLKPQPGG